MELPDEFFADDDAAIVQMHADDDYWMNYRRLEEGKTMTVFVLDDVDAGESLRIANDCGQCGGTGKIDSGAPTPWGDYYEVGCPSCDGSGRLDDGLALTVTDEGGAATIHLTTGQLALLRDWLTANVNACARCGGTGSVTVDSGATPWCTDFITLDCPACNGTGTPTDD